MPALPLLPRRSLAALALATVPALLASPAPSSSTPSLRGELALIREAQQLPGLAAAVWREGQPVAAAAVGLRHLGEPGNALTADDRFALGSVTKRMTHFLIARLVDAGRLRWDLTLAEALPDLPMRAEYRGVTLAQLLSFQGGIAAYERIGPRLTPELFELEGTPAEREARFVAHLLALPPAATPGTAAVYSNASYTLAAHVAARVSGQSYTRLMQEQVFGPLGLKSAGWGRPRAQAAQGDQPWLHIAGPEGLTPEPDRIRPPEALFAAAGGAHMSLGDLARFAQAELLARRGQLPLLKPAAALRWAAGEATTNAAALKARSVYAGGTPWLSACYAVWPAQGLVMATAANAGSPDDAACKAVLERVEAGWL